MDCYLFLAYYALKGADDFAALTAIMTSMSASGPYRAMSIRPTPSWTRAGSAPPCPTSGCAIYIPRWTS